MFWAVVEAIEYVRYGKVGFFIVFFIFCTLFFAVKYYYYKQYRQPEGTYSEPVSIVVAVYKEKPWLFEMCLQTVKQRKSDELIVVFDGVNSELEQIAKKYTDRLYILPHAGKRSALSHGIASASKEIVITIDSDTFFKEDCISNLIKPFSDKRIGAVSANQRIFHPEKSLIRTFANLFEIGAHEFHQLGESARGHIGCLFGRCVAFRKAILLPYLDYYKNETFLGIKCATSDDRLLTDIVIKEHKTVLRRDAMCYTDCPDTWKSYIAQQRRWQNGSQRSTIGRFSWLLKGSKVTAISFLIYIILPFWTIAVWLNWIYVAWIGEYSWIMLPLQTHIIIGTLGAFITWSQRRYYIFGRATLYQVLAWLFWMGVVQVVISSYSFIEIFTKRRLAAQWRTK